MTTTDTEDSSNTELFEKVREYFFSHSPLKIKKKTKVRAGSELIDWMVDQSIATSRPQAVGLIEELVQNKHIVVKSEDQSFTDSEDCAVFWEGEIQSKKEEFIRAKISRGSSKKKKFEKPRNRFSLSPSSFNIIGDRDQDKKKILNTQRLSLEKGKLKPVSRPEFSVSSKNKAFARTEEQQRKRSMSLENSIPPRLELENISRVIGSDIISLRRVPIESIDNGDLNSLKNSGKFLSDKVMERAFQQILSGDNSSHFLRDRRWRLKVYKNSFTGSEMVDWLIEHKFASSREEATEIGIEMLHHKYIKHVSQSKHFKDGYILYQITMPEFTSEFNEEMMDMWEESPNCIPVTIPETAVSKADLWNITILNTSNEKLKIKQISQHLPILVVTLSNYKCKICRNLAMQVFKKQTELEELGIHIISVGRGNKEDTEDFKKQFNFPGNTYIDSDPSFISALCSMDQTITSEKKGELKGHVGGYFCIHPKICNIYSYIRKDVDDFINLDTLLHKIRVFCLEYPQYCWTNYALNTDWRTLGHNRQKELTSFKSESKLNRTKKKSPNVPRSVTVFKLPNIESETSSEESEVAVEKTDKEIMIEGSTTFCLELGSNNSMTAISNLMPTVLLSDPILHYNKYLHNREHYNLVTIHPKLGPIVISIEEGTGPRCTIVWSNKGLHKIVVPEYYTSTSSEILKYILGYAFGRFPKEFNLHKVKVNEEFCSQLSEFETKCFCLNYRFGVLYASKGKCTEEEMYENDQTSEDFEEFMKCLASKVPLNRWPSYSGGLDTEKDKDGTHTYYTFFNQFSIVFHTAPLIPLRRNDPSRKRFIGNDVVVIIFKESEDDVFDPDLMNSQFNHIYIVVEKKKQKKEGTNYRVQVAAKTCVPPFPPYLPNPSIFEKGEDFREFLLTKLVNGETAAVNNSKAFSSRLKLSKEGLLFDIVQPHLKYTTKIKPIKVIPSLSWNKNTVN